MDQEFNLLSILRILGKWKKYIVIATVATMVVSVIVTLLMPNYYESYAEVYAANPERAEPEPISGLEKRDKGLYGDDDDVDRILAIANSNKLKKALIDEFDLANHYGIDISTGKGMERLNVRFSKLYNVTKTQYGAISISIEDTDKELAKKMVSFSRWKINQIAKSLIVESQTNQIKSKKLFVDNQSDALKAINEKIKSAKAKYQIYNVESQGEALANVHTQIESSLNGEYTKLNFLTSIGASRDSINLSKARIKALKKRKQNIDNTVQLLSNGAMEVTQLEEEFIAMNEEIIVEKEKLKKLESSQVENYQPTILVEEEAVALIKSRPKRSILVIGLSLLAFLLSSLVAVFLESTKSVDWKSIYAGK